MRMNYITRVLGYSCLAYSWFSSYATERVRIFYSAINQGNRCFISSQRRQDRLCLYNALHLFFLESLYWYDGVSLRGMLFPIYLCIFYGDSKGSTNWNALGFQYTSTLFMKRGWNEQTCMCRWSHIEWILMLTFCGTGQCWYFQTYSNWF